MPRAGCGVALVAVLAMSGCGSQKAPEPTPVARPCATILVGDTEYDVCAKPGSTADVAAAVNELRGAGEATVKAEETARQAAREADEALERVERLTRDVEDLDKRVIGALDQVVAAQNDTDRANARARLEELRREKAEMDRRINAARDAARKAGRRPAGVTLPQRCLDNPLARGCP